MPRATIAIAVLFAALAASTACDHDRANAAVVAKAGQPLHRVGQLLRMTATAYCRGGRTSSGAMTRDGVVAADPRMIPAGSILRIETRDRRRSGVFRALDTGGGIKGRRLDIFTSSSTAARRFGRRQVLVQVPAH